MGLATIDPHGQKDHTEIHKIPKFGVNQASFYWDTASLTGVSNDWSINYSICTQESAKAVPKLYERPMSSVDIAKDFQGTFMPRKIGL